MPNNSNSVYYIKPKPGAKPNSSSAVSAAPPEKTHKLVLTTTSLRNVVIANATDVLYYEVVTPRWERHLTRVSRLDPNTRCFDPVAELVNGNGREHRNVNGVSGGVEGVREEQDAKRVLALRFYGMGELMPVEEFLHTEQGRSKKEHPDGLRAWFRSKDGPCRHLSQGEAVLARLAYVAIPLPRNASIGPGELGLHHRLIFAGGEAS